ncbi:hypothetical protein SGLAM104S_07492 [Streptomyces glaucescens]
MGRSLTRTAAQAGTAEPGAGPGLSPAEAAAASPSPDGDSGWSRATAGLAAGLALGAGGSVLIHRAAARREAGPRRESSLACSAASDSTVSTLRQPA